MTAVISNYMYQVSFGRTMIILGLLVFISVLGSDKAANTNVFGGCTVFHYMVNETCFRCPDNCQTCVSDTNCTLCRKGFYGPVCENKCDFSCTGTCHKEYGHCTYGCRDGTYPADDNSCQPCSSMCSLCASKSHCVVCNSPYFLDGEQCTMTIGNDNSSTYHATTIILVISAPFVVAGFIAAVLLFYRFYHKQWSTNASITREPTLKVASSTNVVQMDLQSQILFQENNKTGPLDINIHCNEGLQVEERVDVRDVNKTEDSICDIDPDIDVQTGTDTQRAYSAQNEIMFSVTTPASQKNAKRHRTRASKPDSKPKYKDKSGKDHAQCRTRDNIWKQEYMPILPLERCEVACNEMFDKAYYDQVEGFIA